MIDFIHGKYRWGPLSSGVAAVVARGGALA